MGLLIRIVVFLIRKLGPAVLVGVLAWAGAGFWLMWKDGTDFETRHRDHLAQLNAQVVEIQSAIKGADRRKEVITDEITAQGARALQAGKVIATLHHLESTWDRYVGNPEQQKANAEQIRRMEEMKSASLKHTEELKMEFRRKVWERDSLDDRLGKVQDEIAFAEAHDSRFEYYADFAWRRLSWLILGAPVAFLALIWLWQMRTFWKTIPDERPKSVEG